MECHIRRRPVHVVLWSDNQKKNTELRNVPPKSVISVQAQYML